MLPASLRRETENSMKNTAMKIRCLFFLIAAAFAVLPACAQLAPPNSAGVTMGHIHLFVKDVEAQKQFWTATMGGTVVQNGQLMLIQFPGVYIMLRQADPTGPPAGSIVDHFGFAWKDMPTSSPNGKRMASRSSRPEIRIRVTCTDRTAFAWNSLAILPFPLRLR